MSRDTSRSLDRGWLLLLLLQLGVLFTVHNVALPIFDRSGPLVAGQHGLVLGCVDVVWFEVEVRRRARARPLGGSWVSVSRELRLLGDLLDVLNLLARDLLLLLSDPFVLSLVHLFLKGLLLINLAS